MSRKKLTMKFTVHGMKTVFCFQRLQCKFLLQSVMFLLYCFCCWLNVQVWFMFIISISAYNSNTCMYKIRQIQNTHKLDLIKKSLWSKWPCVFVKENRASETKKTCSLLFFIFKSVWHIKGVTIHSIQTCMFGVNIGLL